MHRLSLALLLLSICGAPTATAQSTAGEGPARIQILNADRLDYDKAHNNAQRLIGHVRLQHADAIMTCDSAYVFEDQTMNAYGHIGINQGDTLTITGDRLDYVGRDRMANITGNVHLSDPSMDMTTDALQYDLRQRIAHYHTGARIVSRKEQNTLTSRNGAYLSNARKFQFSGDVLLEHPERTIEADTLHYTTTTGVAEFFGPTRITQGESHMWCDRGTYDTRTERGRFTRNGRVENKGQELRGDSLHYDKKTGVGLAWGHVMVIDTANKMTVLGEVGTHADRTASSMMTGHAELIMQMDTDHLYLHADTLFASNDSSGHKQVVARRGVRFFKSDMQGSCDTMIYNERDSVIALHGDPVLWSSKDQITGRLMTITLLEGKPHRLHVLKDALLASQVDTARTDSLSKHFDQVTGTNMTGYFGAAAEGSGSNEIKRIVAEGNTRTVYFAHEKKEGIDKLIGMDRVDCSRIEVALDSGKVKTITYVTKPDAVMYPISKAPADEMIMKGFVWMGEMRPHNREDIFRSY